MKSRRPYETGKGRVVVRSKTEIEKLKGGKEQIVIGRGFLMKSGKANPSQED